jgi:hypothetical protein
MGALVVKVITAGVLTMTARNIGFHRNPLTGLQVVPLGGFASHVHDFARDLMPHDQRITYNREVSLKNLDIS